MENITHVTRQGSKEFGLTNTNKLIRGMTAVWGLRQEHIRCKVLCVGSGFQE